MIHYDEENKCICWYKIKTPSIKRFYFLQCNGESQEKENLFVLASFLFPVRTDPTSEGECETMTNYGEVII